MINLRRINTAEEYEAAVARQKDPVAVFIESIDEMRYYTWVPNFNNHVYVDLDLPSETYWADRNLDAGSSTDKGRYYSWGDITGQYVRATSGHYICDFSWDTYRFHNGSTYNAANITKYNTTDGKKILDYEDDAVSVSWGGDWHIPTREQFLELINQTNNEWTGSGMRFYSKKDNTKSIYLPAFGAGNIDTIASYGSSIRMQCCDKGTDSRSSYSFQGTSSGCSVISSNRYLGLSVRGVVG